jgi:hypothetical protein
MKIPDVNIVKEIKIIKTVKIILILLSFELISTLYQFISSFFNFLYLIL